jgi:hypothetical protein
MAGTTELLEKQDLLVQKIRALEGMYKKNPDDSDIAAYIAESKEVYTSMEELQQELFDSHGVTPRQLKQGFYHFHINGYNVQLKVCKDRTVAQMYQGTEEELALIWDPGIRNGTDPRYTYPKFWEHPEREISILGSKIVENFHAIVQMTYLDNESYKASVGHTGMCNTKRLGQLQLDN